MERFNFSKHFTITSPAATIGVDLHSEIIHQTCALVSLLTLGVVSLLENLCALIIKLKAKTGKRYKIDDYPVINLLVNNVFVSAIVIPLYGVKKIEHDSVNTHELVCGIWRYSFFLTTHIAMSSVIILTIDRIMALSQPFRYKRIVTRARIMATLVLVDLFWIAMDALPFVPGEKTDDQEQCNYVPTRAWALTMNIIGMCAPLPFIVISYGYMLRLSLTHTMNIKKQTSLTKSTTMENLRTAVQMKATRKVAWVVGTYIMFWGPSTIYYLLVWLCPGCFPSDYEPSKTYIRFFFKLLVMIHAMVTPVIFCWNSKKFRKDAFKISSSLRMSNRNMVIRLSSNRKLKNPSAKVRKRRDKDINSEFEASFIQENEI